MDKGAHFFRTDFQIHSPRDRKWTGRKPVADEERFAFARVFIHACRERGLDAIGITDHHDVCFVKYFQLAAQEQGGPSGNLTIQNLVVDPLRQNPIVFPGVELTLSVPCQAIVLLDADADLTVQAELLQAIGVGNTYPDSERDGPQPTPLQLDLRELDAKIREYASGRLRGKYIILPHVSDQGHKTLLRAGFHMHFAEMPCVGGYIEGDWAAHQGKHRLNGSLPDYGCKAIGVFQTSDSRSEDFQNLGCRSTWVKMAQPSAEALRQACLSRESRLLQERPVLPARYIARIEVSDSTFMGGFSCDFNPQFNAIIGGRGTGKSTILEYLRWAMQDQPLPYDSDLEDSDGVTRKRRLVQDTLVQARGCVTVHWMVDGTDHVVQHNSGSKEITLTVGSEESQSVTAEEIRDLLPIRAYSQKQLSSVGNRTTELQRFIEQPIREELVALASEIAKERKRIIAAYESLVGKQQLERECASARTLLTSLKERATTVEKLLPELGEQSQAAIREHGPRLREEQAVESLLEDGQNATEILRDAARGLAELPRGLLLAEESPQGKTLQEQHTALAKAVQKLREQMTGLEAVLAKDIEAVGTSLRPWRANHEAHLRMYEAAQEEAAAYKKQMSQLRELRVQEAEIQKRLADNEGRLNKLGDPEEQFLRLLKGWIGLHRRRGDALQRQCERLTQLSAGEIRAELVRGADMDEAVAALRDAVKGARIVQDRWDELRTTLLAGDAAIENWQCLMLELRILAESNIDDVPSDISPEPLKTWKLSDKQRLALVEKLQPADWLRIALTSLKDVPQFHYTTAGGEIRFEQASAGQQATALLRVLLGEGGGPLIIDQPEEDLDNAVIEQVVSLLWQAKQERQIIFASHNANLVVNGDAELVIHCDYTSDSNRSHGRIKHEGAIDMRDIRDVITRVMEGGEKAFTLRRQKYGF
ncbi:MAG: AAA family ATPase [Sedimentisphaerales bacterium]|jgi:type III restriction enzyme|nr:AAA family ATPase [Sedimentisphaerales bacterium]